MYSAGVKRHCARLILCIGAGLSFFCSANAQESPSVPVAQDTAQTAPVIIDGTTLFVVRGVSAYPAEKRAQDIADRIRTLAANRAYSPQRLRLENVEIGTDILADNQLIMTVLESDARIEGAHRQVVAQAYLARIGETISQFRRDRSPRILGRHIVFAGIAVLGLWLFLWSGHRVVKKVRLPLERRYRERIHGVQIQSFHLIRAEHLWRLLTAALSLSWAAVALIVTYFDLHYALSLFPWTRGLANSLFALVANPLARMGTSLLKSIPELVFLLILIVVTSYVLKLLRLFCSAIETGAVTFPAFDAAWARPSYRLVRVAVIAFALVVAYPNIPGSGSQAFKGITLFIGLIFSLGSTSLIGNVISGYSMTYRRLFKPGDRVKIGDYVGDVEEVKLMSTYLRTPKNELVAVPNSTIVNSEVVNYSTLSHKGGLILHTTVGVGYDASWRQVEAMLIQAAERTPGLLREPKPFVLQTELRDFAVRYEINAYSANPRSMYELYAALHRNILDLFNEFGVQIMVPAYEADPEQPKIVPKERWYSAPARPSDHEDNGGQAKESAAAQTELVPEDEAPALARRRIRM